ncbi:MAG: serine hydrolase [Lentimicrobiaceae bacterium]|nr:serine hydrolase [Lentimicrobiaceae bacterium]
MKVSLRITLTLLLVLSFSFDNNWISSATFSKSEILTNQDQIELNRILSHEKIIQIDSLLNKYDSQNNFHGNILVAIDGAVVAERAMGYADPIRRTPCNTSMVYQLASVSKQFTAAAIMLLKADGRLDFSDKITKYIPEIPYNSVTISHLLHHTGGMPNYMYLVDKYWNENYPPDNEDVINLMARYKLPVFFRAGYRYSYSNTGYMLLATVVQRVSGLSLNQFLQRRIFAPLGMKDTYVYSSADAEDHKHISGFRPLRRGYASIPETLNDGPVGDKGVCSTLADLFIWDRALYEGFPLSSTLVEEAFTPVVAANGRQVDYGYGFRIKQVNGDKAIYHNGVWEGFRTNFHRYPTHRNTIIALNNTSIRNNHLLVSQIENILYGGNPDDPTKLLVYLTIEEGLDHAFETFLSLSPQERESSVDFQKIIQAAGYLASTGKIHKAAELSQLIEKATATEHSQSKL